MTKVKSIFVNNLRSVSKASLELNGCTAIVLGGNNKGKTTITNALIDRLRGIKPEHIVKQGETNGMYVMELTNGDKLQWTITGGKEKLQVTTPNQIKGSITKELASFYFPKGFDVDKFLSETPAKQREVLQRISNLDFSEIDRAYKEAYENRTYANRRLQEEKTKEILFEPEWVETMQETASIENEINSITAHNLTIKTVAEKIASKETELAKIIESIADYKKLIQQLEDECMKLETDIDNGKNWLKRDDKKPKDEKYKLELKAKLEDKKLNNLAIAQRNSILKATEDSVECEILVKKIITDKDEMIRLANLPEGFEFDQVTGGVKYNGYPYDQKNLSTSALYIGALKLAERVLGEVRTIHFDASYLDKNSLSQIADWAEKNNLQLLIERPDFEGGDITYEIIED